MRKSLLIVLAAGLLCMPVISGCATTGDDQGIELIEDMSEAEYAKWQLYVSLGTKIGASRLLEEGIVTATELELAADVIDALQDSVVSAGATSFIVPALQKAGLTSDEIQFVLLVAEQELLSRGALAGVVDPLTGTVSLSPRTKEMLHIIAESLRSAVKPTEEQS
jgi:hypothetical protein